MERVETNSAHATLAPQLTDAIVLPLKQETMATTSAIPSPHLAMDASPSQAQQYSRTVATLVQREDFSGAEKIATLAVTQNPSDASLLMLKMKTSRVADEARGVEKVAFYQRQAQLEAEQAKRHGNFLQSTGKTPLDNTPQRRQQGGTGYNRFAQTELVKAGGIEAEASDNLTIAKRQLTGAIADLKTYTDSQEASVADTGNMILLAQQGSETSESIRIPGLEPSAKSNPVRKTFTPHQISIISSNTESRQIPVYRNSGSLYTIKPSTRYVVVGYAPREGFLVRSEDGRSILSWGHDGTFVLSNSGASFATIVTMSGDRAALSHKRAPTQQQQNTLNRALPLPAFYGGSGTNISFSATLTSTVNLPSCYGALVISNQSGTVIKTVVSGLPAMTAGQSSPVGMSAFVENQFIEPSALNYSFHLFCQDREIELKRNE